MNGVKNAKHPLKALMQGFDSPDSLCCLVKTDKWDNQKDAKDEFDSLPSILPNKVVFIGYLEQCKKNRELNFPNTVIRFKVKERLII